MTEVSFYHLQSDPIERALPRLLEKVRERGFRVLVRGATEERIETLDEALWSYPAGKLSRKTIFPSATTSRRKRGGKRRREGFYVRRARRFGDELMDVIRHRDRQFFHSPHKHELIRSAFFLFALYAYFELISSLGIEGQI